MSNFRYCAYPTLEQIVWEMWRMTSPSHTYQALGPHGARHHGRRSRPRPLVPRERPGEPRGAVVGRGRVGQARPRVGRHGGRGRRRRRRDRPDGVSRYRVYFVPEDRLRPVSPRRRWRDCRRCASGGKCSRYESSEVEMMGQINLLTSW